tara:strand:+ start:751 stop:1221 length:471 start_codon:yes stop_codon:yes gene_type:complete
MDFKKIKKLVSLVETSDITSLSVEEDNLKVEIKREITEAAPMIQHVAAAAPVAQPAPPVEAAPIAAEPIEASPIETNLLEIQSPMVGTFYASPNPESSAFVSIGSAVQKGDIVCIIEAMKLFNEIESEVTGTIEKICVENGASIEFGQTLFLVRPN